MSGPNDLKTESSGRNPQLILVRQFLGKCFYSSLVETRICWSTKAKFVRHTSENPKCAFREVNSLADGYEELQFSLRA